MADTLPSFPVPALQCQVYCGQNADLSEFGNPSVISLGRFPPLPLENGPLVSSLRISVNNLRNLIVSPVLLLVLSKFCAVTWLPGGGGGTWAFFGLVCAARDSKLAPRSRICPKTDTPF